MSISFSDYYRKNIKFKKFTLAEANSRGQGGIGSTNNPLERMNGVHKQDLTYNKEQLTQYVQTACAWLEAESNRDSQFSPKMAQGYTYTHKDTGIFVDKRVWGPHFWSRVTKEFERLDGLGVHNLLFKYGEGFVVCSEYLRAQFVSEKGQLQTHYIVYSVYNIYDSLTFHCDLFVLFVFS